MHAKCGYSFTADARTQELTRPEINTLWAGYSLWMEHVDPMTAGDEKEQGDFDEKGNYRGSGRARNAAKPTKEFEQKFEKFAADVNGPSRN